MCWPHGHRLPALAAGRSGGRAKLKNIVKTETIQPRKALSGGLELPGDKSISHRYAMLAALANGTSELRNFAAARDCHSTLGCIKSLGAGVKVEGAKVQVTGHGLRGLKSSWRTLDAENSGTTIRLLSGILSGQSFATKITGDASLQRRPMKRVISPLREMGADIRGRDENFPPLEIRGGKLRGIRYQMPMASAQVKSAVLLAGLYAEGETSVTEPVGTRDHTELALLEFDAPVRTNGRTISIRGLAAEGDNGNPALRAISADVPGDLSSAVFFIAAASILPDSNLYIGNVGLNPTRAAVLDFFKQMGAAVSIVGLQTRHGEVVGDLAIKGAGLKGGVVSGNLVPLLIDELPMLAALGPYTEQGIGIRDAGELRVKESDRIAALAENLKRMGATVEEMPDGLRVSPGPLQGAEIDPRGDHRIAMAFAVAGLAASGETKILDADCAGVSYPTFFEELRRLAE
jgi:3-phosphoshikimate 1-carboxyvinyltransferase